MDREDDLIKKIEKQLEELRGDPNAHPLQDYAKKKKVFTSKLNLKCIKTLSGHFAKIYTICWSAKSKILSASQDGKMIVWDPITRNKIKSVPLKSSWVMTCAFSPNENNLASGGLDNMCSIFITDNDPNGKITVKEFAGHEGYISCIKFMDESRFISSSGDKTCKQWDMKRKKPVRSFEAHTEDVMSVAVKKASQIFVSGSCDSTVRVFDTRTGGSVMAFTGHESDINSVCLVSDTDCICTGSDDSSCRLFDMRSHKQLNRYVSDKILCGITSVVSSNGGKYLFAGYDDYNVYAWDMLTGEPSMVKIAHINRVSCIDLSRDGQALATGSWDTLVKIWA